MAKLTKYQKAKKKWFYANIIEFRVQYYDRITNNSIIYYDIMQGLEVRWHNCYTNKLKQYAYMLSKLEPWQIYFRTRIFRNNLTPGTLTFTDCRRNEKCLK